VTQVDLSVIEQALEAMRAREYEKGYQAGWTERKKRGLTDGLGPRAAVGGFPYAHRTQAEVEASHWQKVSELASLEKRGKYRALNEVESLRLERLVRYFDARKS